MNQNDMRCTVCRQQKVQLRPRKSRLMKDLQMFLCNECFVNKREPRFAIIMVGMKHLKDSQPLGSILEDCIKNRRYVGEDILLSDLIK